MSPIAAWNVAAVITFTPGTLISRLTSTEPSASSATTRSSSAISRSRKSIWRRQPSTVSRSSTGNSKAQSQRRPANPNRSLTPGFVIKRRISAAWTSFLARVRARTSCERRARRRRSARVRSSGVQSRSRIPPFGWSSSSTSSRSTPSPSSLGHSSIQTTGDVYADWDIDQLATTLADLLSDEDQ
jgi:hypothetical protein